VSGNAEGSDTTTLLVVAKGDSAKAVTAAVKKNENRQNPSRL
jgi:hypothetical protein